MTAHKPVLSASLAAAAVLAAGGNSKAEAQQAPAAPEVYAYSVQLSGSDNIWKCATDNSQGREFVAAIGVETAYNTQAVPGSILVQRRKPGLDPMNAVVKGDTVYGPTQDGKFAKLTDKDLTKAILASLDEVRGICTRFNKDVADLASRSVFGPNKKITPPPVPLNIRLPNGQSQTINAQFQIYRAANFPWNGPVESPQPPQPAPVPQSTQQPTPGN